MIRISKRQLRQTVLSAIGLASAACLALAWYVGRPWPAAGGLMGLVFLASRIPGRSAPAAIPTHDKADPPAKSATPPCRAIVDPHDAAAVIDQMLAERRYACLLSPEAVGSLTPAQFGDALNMLEQYSALVPEGDVLLGTLDEALDEVNPAALEAIAGGLRMVRVGACFLDRYQVTNRQYYDFVASGAYGQMPLWAESIWPAVFDFVDRTGNPGPRFWIDGCYPEGKEDHPVVGISWFEAAAYAQWVGKRLPCDAEWVKAACWPVALTPGAPVQRRYPWGNVMDRARANLWGSGPGQTVPVSEFPAGTSVGGVCQLIGNVWEWTADDFRPSDHPCGDLTLPSPMKCLRGGAFDTYFDNQATCRFASGENPLARKHNVGFRCAVSLADLVLSVEPAARLAGEAEEVHA